MTTPVPLRLAGATAQLAFLGVVGPLVLFVPMVLLGTGIGLLPLLGVGVLLFVVLVYVLYGIGWLEAARVEGLYRFGIPSRRPRRSPRGGFGGFVRTIGLQAIDPWMWRAIANAAIATVLGLIVVGLLSVVGGGLALAFSPIFAVDGRVPLPFFDAQLDAAWAVPFGIIAAIVAAALVIGAALLDGVLSRAILVPSREVQLAEEARLSSERAWVSTSQRADAVHAAAVERTRLERDLHDGVQPRLVSVGMTLGLAQQKIDSDPDAAKALIAEAHTSTKAAITELRQLARGIHAAVLDDRGLDAALSALAARSVVPVSLDVRVDGRCSRDAEAAAYFAIAEALTNAAKHARASAVRVVVRRRDDPVSGGGTLWARVEDDGVGGASVLPGGGLDGILHRVTAAGGTARIDSPAGGPTSIELSVPCAS